MLVQMVQFASYLGRVKTRLIFPRINGPIVTVLGFFRNRCRIGQLHDNVILLQLAEAFSVLFSYEN